MKNTPKYVVERHEHGWLICSAPHQAGLPLDCLSEVGALFSRKAVMLTGVGDYYQKSGRAKVVFAIAEPAAGERWISEIRADLATLPPQEAWWFGVDVGMSSAAIFAVFCDETFKNAAHEFANGATPRDADDFGRCVNLLRLFPEWKSQLHRVAEAYPKTGWPRIVARWSELESSDATTCSGILASI